MREIGIQVALCFDEHFRQMGYRIEPFTFYYFYDKSQKMLEDTVRTYAYRDAIKESDMKARRQNDNCLLNHLVTWLSSRELCCEKTLYCKEDAKEDVE